MRDTRNNILKAAQDLFNEEGLNNVTLRQIAQKLKMSQGNLNYHFKLKEDIIESLYFSLVEEMDEQMAEMNIQGSKMALLYQSSKISMHIMYEYRFILMDFSFIMNNNSKIKLHYNELQKIRANQFQLVFNQLVKDGFMRSEELKNEYIRLYERLNIVGDGWINVYTTFGTEKSVNYYCELLFEMIYPYLTEKGKKAYREIPK